MLDSLKDALNTCANVGSNIGSVDANFIAPVTDYIFVERGGATNADRPGFKLHCRCLTLHAVGLVSAAGRIEPDRPRGPKNAQSITAEWLGRYEGKSNRNDQYS